MLIDQYDPEDVFARVPELADQTDPVLVQLDRLLDDDQLYQQVRHDLARRYRLTLVHGRHSTPAEVILRLLVVQHLYAWSYQETVERVADSLVLRWFCRVYFQRVPDKTTLLRWAHTMQPQTLQALIDHIGRLARQAHVTTAHKLRVDSTCVQTAIHHPTDSGLLGDGVRVLARLLRRAKPLVAEQVAGDAGDDWRFAAICGRSVGCSSRCIGYAAKKAIRLPSNNVGCIGGCSIQRGKRCGKPNGSWRRSQQRRSPTGASTSGPSGCTRSSPMSCHWWSG